MAISNGSFTLAGSATRKKPSSVAQVADRSLVEVQHAVRRGEEGVLDAMLDEDDGRPFVREAAHEAQQSLGGQRVEVREGLVKHDEARHQHERARDRHLLRLAARELVGGAFGEVLQLGPGDHATERLGDLGRRDAKVLRAERQLAAHGGGHELLARILEHGTHQSSQVAQPKLPRRAAVDANAPGHLASIRMRDQAVQRADEGALPTAGRAGHQEHLARLDAQREVADGRLRGAAVLKGEVVDLDDRAVGHRSGGLDANRCVVGKAQALRRGATVDADRQAGVVRILVQEWRSGLHRPERRLPRDLVDGGADAHREAIARLEPVAERCQVRRLPGQTTVAEGVDEEDAGVEATVAKICPGRSSRASSVGSMAGPTSPIGVPAARWAATGAKMSRPWNVCETLLRQSDRFSRVCAATTPPSRSAAGTSRPLSGPTKRSPRATWSAIGRRSVPTPGSITARCTPTGR